MRVLDFDLSVPRVDLKVGIGFPAILFVAVPDQLSVKVDDLSGDSIPVVESLAIESDSGNIDNLFLTNVAGSGVASVMLLDGR